MAATPYMTSSDLIACVKRKIMFPSSQDTFTDNDILAFCNEEMFVSQVPSVLELHQEYFVYTTTVDLVATQKRYPIPSRAVAMKLRAVFLEDDNQNQYEMTRISSEDRTFFQSGNGSVNTLYTYYLQGNDLVLTSDLSPVPPSKLVFVFFIRPNQLVPNNRAAIIQSFQQTVTVSTVNPGDSITVTLTQGVQVQTATFTAVSGAPGSFQFQIGGNAVATANNLVAAINTWGLVTASNVASSSATITLLFDVINTVVTSLNAAHTDTASGIVVNSDNLTINFNQVPTSIVNADGTTEVVFSNGALTDFLQTNPGHRTLAYDIPIPTNGISGSSITYLTETVPLTVLIGDYVCLANESIIPQIPPDLHNGLAERAGARILAALGDQQGLQASLQKIQEIDKRQGTLLDNRVEGNPIKVTNRHSPLAYNKMNYRRLM